MTVKKLVSTLACMMILAVAACSEDAPVADPGGQGAGRPDGSEEPAATILQQNDYPANQDTTRSGSDGMTGALRDSLNDGEAIPSASMPQPERPAPDAR